MDELRRLAKIRDNALVKLEILLFWIGREMGRRQIEELVKG